MGWTCSFYADGINFHLIRQKADRIGVSVSKIVNRAVTEYLKNHPRDQEEEERKLYDRR